MQKLKVKLKVEIPEHCEPLTDLHRLITKLNRAMYFNDIEVLPHIGHTMMINGITFLVEAVNHCYVTDMKYVFNQDIQLRVYEIELKVK